MCRYQEKSQGFTIMELSIALVIFMVGLMGLLQLLVVAVTVSQRSRDTSMATALAQAKADELLRRGFDAPQLKPGGVIPTNTAINPAVSPNPSLQNCYTDLFTFEGAFISGPASPCTASSTMTLPPIAYFIRQWQVCYCDAGCGATGDRCTPACATGKLKKITVTVTALSPIVRGRLTSATVVVYVSSLN